jgi:undecaprenyl-diphosphatase
LQITAFDIALLDWLHSHTVPGSIPVLQAISDTTTLLSIAMALVVLVLYFVKREKKRLVKVAVLVVVLLTVLVVTQGMKSLIDRDRPFTTYPHIEKLSSGGDSSFPSGHTIEAFAMAAALSRLFAKRRFIIPLYLWAVLVAYSRMALGVHYPTDILAGMAIGTLIGFFIPWIFSRKVNKTETLS